MNDHDVERALRAAGARVRATAPDDAATAAAWTRLLKRPPTPSRWRWTGPALIVAAAAAAVIGALVLTRPSDTVRQIPATFPSGPEPSTAPSPRPTTSDELVVVTADPDGSTVPAVTDASPSPPASSMTTATSVTTTAPSVVPSSAPAAGPPPTAATTAPNTSPATTAATTPPAVAGPAFVGDPPLSAPARLLGCPGTLGDVAAVIPPERTPITALGCSSNTGAEFGSAIATAIGADGAAIALTYTAPTWSISTAAPDQTLALPIPPAELLRAAGGDTGPFDATERITALDDVPAGTDPATLATTIGQRLIADDIDPIPDVATAVLPGVDAVTITLTGIGDDAAAGLVYVVWYQDNGGVLSATRAAYSPICARSISDSEPYPLCV